MRNAEQEYTELSLDERKIQWGSALLATICHTAILYGAPKAGLRSVDIARILGSSLFPKLSPNGMMLAGMAVHFALGTILFPTAFNAVARRFLPKQKTVATFDWAIILFFTGRNVIIPLLGASNTFKRKPSATVTYLLAHIAYGLVCGKD